MKKEGENTEDWMTGLNLQKTKTKQKPCHPLGKMWERANHDVKKAINQLR